MPRENSQQYAMKKQRTNSPRFKSSSQLKPTRQLEGQAGDVGMQPLVPCLCFAVVVVVALHWHTAGVANTLPVCVMAVSCDLLVGLVVKVSASRAEDPGFESRL